MRSSLTRQPNGFLVFSIEAKAKQPPKGKSGQGLRPLQIALRRIFCSRALNPSTKQLRSRKKLRLKALHHPTDLQRHGRYRTWRPSFSKASKILDCEGNTTFVCRSGLGEAYSAPKSATA